MNPKTKEPDSVRGLDGSSYAVKSRQIRGKGEALKEFDLSSINTDEDTSGKVVVKKETKGDKIISTKKALTYVVIFTIISEIVGIILINYNLIVAVSFIALGIGAIGAGIMGALMPEPQKKG